ncbi:MAG: hypothetical protein WAK60_02205 [Sedimentisphaerales bacterium]
MTSERNIAAGATKGETLEPTLKQSRTPRCVRQKKDNNIAAADQESVDRLRFEIVVVRASRSAANKLADGSEPASARPSGGFIANLFLMLIFDSAAVNL